METNGTESKTNADDDNADNLLNKRSIEDKGDDEPVLAKRKMSGVSSSDYDQEYFKSYDFLGIHAEMVGDFARTFTYQQAILKNYERFYGKVVVDVGCGTGILSVFCAQAGAKKVYAIDASDIAKEAEKIVAANNMGDKIVVIHSTVEEANIPEKVDIIVSEWMGHMLLYESMLDSVLFAKEKWLKPDGLIFPEKAYMFMALIEKTDEWAHSVDMWHDIESTHKVNMSPLAENAANELCSRVTLATVPGEIIISRPAKILEINLNTCRPLRETGKLNLPFQLVSYGDEDLYGFVIWFSVNFPGNIILSTSPYEKETHWRQATLHVHPFPIKQDTCVHGVLTIMNNAVNHRFLDLELDFFINDKPQKKYFYVIDYYC